MLMAAQPTDNVFAQRAGFAAPGAAPGGMTAAPGSEIRRALPIRMPGAPGAPIAGPVMQPGGPMRPVGMPAMPMQPGAGGFVPARPSMMMPQPGAMPSAAPGAGSTVLQHPAVQDFLRRRLMGMSA